MAPVEVRVRLFASCVSTCFVFSLPPLGCCFAITICRLLGAREKLGNFRNERLLQKNRGSMKMDTGSATQVSDVPGGTLFLETDVKILQMGLTEGIFHGRKIHLRLLSDEGLTKL